MFGLAVLAVVLIVVLFIAAAVLKAAVSFLNKITGNQDDPMPYYPSMQQGPQTPSFMGPTSNNPYAAPTTTGPAPYVSRPGGKIAEPGYGKAIGIVLLRGFVNNAAGFALGFVFGLVAPQAVPAGQADPQDPMAIVREMWTQQLGLMLASLAISFFLGALLLKVMLPTTYGKACLVQLLEYLVYLLIAGVILGIIFAISLA
jgi:hypothetical protein